jgi:hypothetical protein
MGTFGSPLWGGSGSGSSAGGAVGVALSSIVSRAYRIAGISKWVGTTLQADWFLEAIPELNAMIGGLNNSRLNIFTLRIDAFPISGGTKSFTIGPGAVFSMPRPQKIEQGVIILSASTPGAVRMPPMYQMNDEEWSNIALQDVPNGIPLAFYYDGSFDPVTGFGVVFLWTQTTASYQVEWYSWQSIPTFLAATDTVALPPGYEDMLVYSLAERLAALNPHLQKMDAMSYQIARKARAAIQHLNATEPKVVENDAAGVGRHGGGGHWDYRIGRMR